MSYRELPITKRSEEEAPLPCVALFEAAVEEAEEFHIADQAPWGLIDEAGRDFSCEAFNVEVGTEMFEHVGEEVEILFEGEFHEIIGAFGIFLLHLRSLNYLKLMELDRAERQGIYHGAGVEHHLLCLARQSEYEMGAGVYSSGGSHFDGTAGSLEVVAAVDALQSRVMAGFYAVFHYYYRCRALFTADGARPVFHDSALREGGQIVEFLLIDAVGPCAYDYAYYMRVVKGLFIKFLQSRKRCVSV